MQAENFFLPRVVADADDELVPKSFGKRPAEITISGQRTQRVYGLSDGLALLSMTMRKTDAFCCDADIFGIIPMQYLLQVIVVLRFDLLRAKTVDKNLERYVRAVSYDGTPCCRHHAIRVKQAQFRTDGCNKSIPLFKGRIGQTETEGHVP